MIIFWTTIRLFHVLFFSYFRNYNYLKRIIWLWWRNIVISNNIDLIEFQIFIAQLISVQFGIFKSSINIYKHSSNFSFNTMKESYLINEQLYEDEFKLNVTDPDCVRRGENGTVLGELCVPTNSNKCKNCTKSLFLACRYSLRARYSYKKTRILSLYF